MTNTNDNVLSHTIGAQCVMCDPAINWLPLQGEVHLPRELANISDGKYGHSFGRLISKYKANFKNFFAAQNEGISIQLLKRKFCAAQMGEFVKFLSGLFS